MKINTGLLVLLIIPLLGASDTPPENISDLAIWLQRLNDQQVETHKFVEVLAQFANVTFQQSVLLQEDIEVLKGRLAIAAVFSSVYMIISTLLLIGQLVVLVKKSVKNHQLKRHEEEVELMDRRLQERRERRRASARAKSGSPRHQ